MRVVLDTNLVISAILRDRRPEKVLLFIISRPDFEWVASPEILAEYREVLRRPKFALPDHLLSRWDERFRSAIAEWCGRSKLQLPSRAIQKMPNSWLALWLPTRTSS